jgi:hypothetical protein
MADTRQDQMDCTTGAASSFPAAARRCGGAPCFAMSWKSLSPTCSEKATVFSASVDMRLEKHSLYSPVRAAGTVNVPCFSRCTE